MKHSLKDILGIFSAHAGHTHEAAVQATYDAGHAAGVAEVKDKLMDGDDALHKELDARYRAKLTVNEPESTDETKKAEDTTDPAAAPGAPEEPAPQVDGGQAPAPAPAGA